MLIRLFVELLVIVLCWFWLIDGIFVIGDVLLVLRSCFLLCFYLVVCVGKINYFVLFCLVRVVYDFFLNYFIDSFEVILFDYWRDCYFLDILKYFLVVFGFFFVL